HAGLENDRLRRQALFVLADHKQHPRRALEGRRDHGGLARNRVTKSTFVVLISIVNATSDQKRGPSLEKNDVCLLCHTPFNPKGVATRGGGCPPGIAIRRVAARVFACMRRRFVQGVSPSALSSALAANHSLMSSAQPFAANRNRRTASSFALSRSANSPAQKLASQTWFFFFLASGSSAAANTASGAIRPRNERTIGAGHGVMSILVLACDRWLGALLRCATISAHSALYASAGSSSLALLTSV